MAALVRVRSKLLALFPELDAGFPDVLEIAAFVAGDLALLSRAQIAVAIDRSSEWVNRGILRVQLRMVRDPRFRAKVEALEARLQAALGS